MLRLTVTNLKVFGKYLVGNLAYLPYNMFVDEYVFVAGDVVIDDGDECYIEMDDDRFFSLVYEDSY